MIAYLAIIKDSFREALSSRVLWIVLLLVTLLLCAVVPFTWDGAIAAKLDASDIRSTQNLIIELQAANEKEATQLQDHVWNSLSDDTRKRLKGMTDVRGPQRFRIRESIVKDFNRIIDRDDFFQAELWEEVVLGKRLEDLLGQDDLSPELAKQRNRLALEAALPNQIQRCPEEAMVFRYASWELEFVPPLPRATAAEQIDFVVLTAISLFAGFFGIFAAILVTAPIIPNMLGSGSLYLLLSKPIARPLLFLAKFAGGCSFVLINVGYLVLGVFLIIGMRFDIWKPQLLWAIPIFLFSFAIFYSVSAFSGLVWRNTVLAIGITVLFWALCFTIGLTRGLMQQFIMVPTQIGSLLPANDQMFVRRGDGEMGMWSEPEGTIVEIMKRKRNGRESMMGPRSRTVSMTYDAKNEALITLEREWSQANIVTALGANGWIREQPSGAPKNSIALFIRDGKPIVVADQGVFEVSLDEVEEKLPDINIFGLRIPASAPKDSHLLISEDIGRLKPNSRATFDSTEDRIYLQSGQDLTVFTVQDEQFEVSANAELDFREITHMAAAKGVVAIASSQGDTTLIHIRNGAELSEVTQLNTASDDETRQLEISDDGRWVAVLLEDESMKVFDLDNDGKATDVDDSVCAFKLDGSNLVLAYENDRVVTKSLAELKTQGSIRPSLPWVKRIYRLGVNPIYTVCPKPSELENTMSYAITGKDTQRLEGPGFGPGGRTVKLNPWRPIYSNSIFIAVMLSLGCIYVYRQDF